MAQELKAYGMNDPEVGDEYEMYKVSEVDAVLAEKDAEIRRLKRALWLARAERAMAETYSVLNDVLTSNRWVKALNKLKAKAEEYK